MDSNTTPQPSRYGYCATCGRALTHPRSNAHGMGPCCWRSYLDSLSEDDRAREAMRGYNWYKTGDLYIVVGPEHQAYQVDPNLPSCECIAYQSGNGKLCKHILYIRREVGWTAQSPEATEPAQEGQETASLPQMNSFHIQLGAKHNPPGYATVRGDGTFYRVNWQRPFCTCPDFTRDHEICVHIRAAQDEANCQAAARRAQAETPEARRARVQADIDAVFDER